MTLFQRIEQWTLRKNIRTWVAHHVIVWSAAFVHPVAGVFLAGWYFRRDQVQVANVGTGWSVDNLVDVLAPITASIMSLMFWASSLALPWWIR